MKALEHEGILLRYSELLTSPVEADLLGQKLKLN